MTRALLIGLAWLSLSALVGILIGRAIHLADLRGHGVSRQPRAKAHLRLAVVSSHERPMHGTTCAHDVVERWDGQVLRPPPARRRSAPPSVDDDWTPPPG